MKPEELLGYSGSSNFNVFPKYIYCCLNHIITNDAKNDFGLVSGDLKTKLFSWTIWVHLSNFFLMDHLFVFSKLDVVVFFLKKNKPRIF